MTQEDALNILKLGHSVFLTGGAGSGKTYVLNQYIKWLKSHVISTAVTASTGIAATHIGGVTIHSWSGIGIKDRLSEYDIDELEQKKALYTRYKSTQVLIIDEISMLHAQRLDMVDLVARIIRKDERPFGGMQVVFCGDFFQLPPVSKNKNIEIKDFAFNAKVWKKMNPVVCYLTTEYRHTGDSLSLLLRDMRSGIFQDHHKKTLLASTKKSVAHTTHTKLFTHNEDVDRINDAEYSLIEGDEKVFEMTTKGKSNLVDSLMQNCLAPEILKLKVGTRVMFVKNDQGKRYNNGTLGIVSKFTNLNVPIVKTVTGEEITVTQDVWRIEEDGKIKAEIKQLPLRYAWAITVHKSQGMTLDAAQIDLSKTFTFGMGYVALSRVRTIDGVELLGFHDDAFLMHPEILRLDKDLHERSIRAGKALAKYSDDMLKKLHENFIVRADGVKDEQSIDAEEENLPSKEITRRLLEEKLLIEDIATKRDLTVGTIISHIEDLIADRVKLNLSYLVNTIPHHKIIQNTINKYPEAKLKELMEILKKKKTNIPFEDIRLIRAYVLNK